jgi:RES domain-containing protein
LKAWRICNKNYATTAFSGEGAYRYAGRWNSVGVRLVYLGATPSITVLEALVHVASLSDLDILEYVLIPVEFEEALVEELVDPLPSDWAEYPAPLSTAAIGDAWIASNRSVLLKVPSAVVSLENNYLLNPGHPDFSKVSIGTPLEMKVDIRLKNLYSGAPATGMFRDILIRPQPS